jgi:hypothetical protein
MSSESFHRLAVCCLASVGLVGMAAIAPSEPPTRSRESTVKTSDTSTTFSAYVSSKGDISRPTDYRETFRHLGTWAVAKEANTPVHEMHNVYAQPDAIKAFQQNGKFPDGAVLVKEITNVSADKLTTGQSTWSTDNKIWFVMIKDSKGRFPGNGLWGDGWGWALFEAKEPSRNVATNFKNDCLPCHVPAKQDDWVYIRGYPLLSKHAAAR